MFSASFPIGTGAVKSLQLATIAQLMISANITEGRYFGYYSIEDDINSGATYSREPVVSGNIVSSPHYDNMAVWMRTAVEKAKG